MTRRTALLSAGLLAVLATYAVVLGLVQREAGLWPARVVLIVGSAAWVAAVGALRSMSLTPRATLRIVLAGGAVLGIAALTFHPATSSDAYRYVWDGVVQLHGVDPYRYTPASPQLAHLRPSDLFGAPAHCQYHFRGGCTSINRPTVHTVYPPFAEGAFALIRLLSFGHGGVLPFQLAGLVGSLAVGVLVWRWTAVRGRAWLSAVWTWSPVTITQYVNNGHVDWLAVLLVTVALATPVARRSGWSGALVGAAIATKLYPVLALPSLMRRRPVATVAGAVTVLVLVYLPHVLAVGTGVLGFLPDYLQQEDYTSGGRELILGLILPHPYDSVLAVLVVAAVALWAWRRADPDRPERSALVVVGVALLAFTPSYGWYMGLLVVLVALTGEFAWLPLCMAGCFAYLARGNDAKWFYIGSLVVVVVATWWSRRTTKAAADGPRRPS